jgi:hypothetical protein
MKSSLNFISFLSERKRASGEKNKIYIRGNYTNLNVVVVAVFNFCSLAGIEKCCCRQQLGFVSVNVELKESRVTNTKHIKKLVN